MKSQKEVVNPVGHHVGHGPAKRSSATSLASPTPFFHVHGGKAGDDESDHSSNALVPIRRKIEEFDVDPPSAPEDAGGSSNSTSKWHDAAEKALQNEKEDHVPLLIEMYDPEWLATGYFVLFLFTCLVPLALVFNVPLILWMWWLGALAILLSVIAMRLYDHHDDQQKTLKVMQGHAFSLVIFLVVGLRYIIMGTFVGGIVLSICVTTMQLIMLGLMAWFVKPGKLLLSGMVFVVLQWCHAIMIASGDHQTESLSRMVFVVVMVLLVLSYGFHHPTPKSHLPRVAFRNNSQKKKSSAGCLLRATNRWMHKLSAVGSSGKELIGRQRSYSAGSLGVKYVETVAFVQRVLVVFAYLYYAVLMPAITDAGCSSDVVRWWRHWGGWLGLTSFCLLLSNKNSPLVGDRCSNGSVLAFNIWVWKGWYCVHGLGTGSRVLLQLAFSALVSVLFFLELDYSAYKDLLRRHAAEKERGLGLGAIATIFLSRLVLITMAVSFATMLVVGPVFASAEFFREIDGCYTLTGQVSEEHINGIYPPLDLGLAPGIAIGPAANSTAASTSDSLRFNKTLRFNETLLVGLHNAYHQRSPFAGIMQFWGYSHPPLSKQLERGYRELEIDVHWKRNAVDWRVFHVIMFDQATSCSCLSDCLGQVRRWMDENEDHSPILIHIEPRGYNYNDLFCDRSDGRQRFIELQQEIYDLFSDRIYYPDELTEGYPNIHTALAEKGWPEVNTCMRGKVVFNLNLFPSNSACRDLYWSIPGASHSHRLVVGVRKIIDKSERLAKELNPEDKKGYAPTSATIRQMAESGSSGSSGSSSCSSSSGSSGSSGEEWMQRERKVFFSRGSLNEAKVSNTTAMMEVSSGLAAQNPAIFDHGFITRYRIGKEPEDSKTIISNHKIIPATLISYDGVWAG